MGEEEKALVWSALESGQLAQGPRVEQFESEFADYVGSDAAVATSSGTTALQLALMALSIGRGDEVVTVAFTFTATVSPLLHIGATPIFVDVEPTSFNMDVDELDAAISPRTRAILPVSLYGNPADLPAISEVASRHGIPLIEDACQAHGAEIDGRCSGSWGIGVFSFYPTKNMTTGEGGIITTSDLAVADRARLLRQHGMRERYRPEILGHNFRMTDLHASIGLAQLAKLPAANARRQAIATRYDAELRGVITPKRRPGTVHAYHQYTLRVAHRDEFQKRLTQGGVGSNVYYPVPVHRQVPFQGLESSRRRLPVTDRLTDEILAIPVYPSLTDDEVSTVIEAVNRTAGELGELPRDA
jgi:perosamine synthetase